MRVRRSAIGSVIPMANLLPTRLRHAGDPPPQREPPEADAAKSELAIDSARPAAALTAGVLAHLELRFPRRFDDQALLWHSPLSLRYQFAKGMPKSRSSSLASSSVFAVVTKVIFRPRMASTRAHSLSG